VLKRIIPAVKRVKFASGRMSYIILKGCWCHVIIVNINAPTKVKLMMCRTASIFPEYHMKMLLGDFIAKYTRKTFLNQQLELKST
jgi:hypothetical protein